MLNNPAHSILYCVWLSIAQKHERNKIQSQGMSVSITAMSMYTVYEYTREEHVLKKDTI